MVQGTEDCVITTDTVSKTQAAGTKANTWFLQRPKEKFARKEGGRRKNLMSEETLQLSAMWAFSES